MIETNGLTKSYGSKRALDGLDLRVEDGEWFLLLGLNGAGKSTTMRLLTGLAEPSAGTALVAGLDPFREGPAVRGRIGYLSEDFAPYEYLTGREYLQFVGDVHGIERAERDRRADRLLELLDLGDASRELCAGYSHGMRKKIGLAGALIHEPRALVLDEPTAELDPRSSDRVRRVLRGLADRGVTVLMSTHILGTVEHHCDRVGILHDGRLACVGRPDELVAASGDASLEALFLSVTGEADDEKVRAYLEGRRG